MSDGASQFSPSALRHRDPSQVVAPLLADEATLARIRQALAYFDQGHPGIPWDQVQARARERRDKRTV